MAVKRVFMIVLDSFGIGEAPDAGMFGDEGSNTLASIAASQEFHTPNMKRLGLFNIDGVTCKEGEEQPMGAFARLREASMGKDTTTGHWEIAGIISPEPMPLYPQGFPEEVLKPFREQTGRGVLCNRPYSGTEVIRDYGGEHMRTGDLIVYTSADSVFQIAAHEQVVPPEKLYEYCRTARKILTGKHAVGRVIARPFEGAYPDFVRTRNRHDFSLLPPADTVMDLLERAGYDTYGVGKINDIFAGKGIAHTQSIKDNEDGMEKTLELLEKPFKGLCFVNLVDFDMVYGHRNDVDGYAAAMTRFDRQLGVFLERMRSMDVLLITGDHGCDPGTPSTDHSREYVPLLAYGSEVKAGVSLGTRQSFADIAATIQEIFGVEGAICGSSFWGDIRNDR